MEPAAISRPDPETVTISGYEVDRRYGPHTVQTTHPDDVSQPHPRIGEPGQYPFTRGIHEGMYRTRLWTMRGCRLWFGRRHQSAIQVSVGKRGARKRTLVCRRLLISPP